MSRDIAVLFCLLAASPVSAKAAKDPEAEKAALSRASTLKMVDYFLKTPTPQLPVEAVPDFLAVDPATLPAKLREQYAAKREELLALKKISDGKRKAPLRRLGVEEQARCGAPNKAASMRFYAAMGFVEIEEREARRLMSDTSCSECEMEVEFTLTLVETPPAKKGGRPVIHYLLHERDPLLVLVEGYRAGAKTRGTNFFGVSASPKCR